MPEMNISEFNISYSTHWKLSGVYFSKKITLGHYTIFHLLEKFLGQVFLSISVPI